MVQERRRKQSINRQVGLSVIYCQINSVFFPICFWCGSASCLVCVSVCLSVHVWGKRSQRSLTKYKTINATMDSMEEKTELYHLKTFDFLLLRRLVARLIFNTEIFGFGLENSSLENWSFIFIMSAWGKIMQKLQQRSHHSAVTRSLSELRMRLDSSQLLLLCSFSSNSLWRWCF